MLGCHTMVIGSHFMGTSTTTKHNLPSMLHVVKSNFISIAWIDLSLDQDVKRLASHWFPKRQAWHLLNIVDGPFSHQIMNSSRMIRLWSPTPLRKKQRKNGMKFEKNAHNWMKLTMFGLQADCLHNISSIIDSLKLTVSSFNFFRRSCFPCHFYWIRLPWAHQWNALKMCSYLSIILPILLIFPLNNPHIVTK